MKWNNIIGGLFLLAQIASVAYARFIPERFFCWAPFDEHTRIKTSVTINGESLSTEAMNQRYRYYVNGWEVRDVHNVFAIIEGYEDTYGRNDEAEVVVKYSINGHTEQEWHYPKQPRP